MTNQLIDQFGRVHTSLRVSVTDRCNIRCTYCMPAENVTFQPHHQLLTFEEIARLVKIATQLGISDVRITGGEPLVRRELPSLIGMLASIEPSIDLAMTTNGILLADHAADLRRAGLRRLNISLDTLSEEDFQEITRRSGLEKVISGIDAALTTGFEKIRINALAIRGYTERQLSQLVQFATSRTVELRFIEFMPLDADQDWQTDTVLSGSEIKSLIESRFGPMDEAPRPDRSQPAMDFVLRRTGTRLGFINPVSEPFCDQCNRLRLTAEGRFRNCLFSTIEWDVKNLLRSGAADAVIMEQIRDCVAAKKRGHGIDDPAFTRPAKAMYQIGG